MEFSDFTPIQGSSRTKRQELVAIDRFTGGAAHQLKFNAEYADRPHLKGRITLDLKRAEPWARGLLALTVRDLIEGDIAMGYGASKGFGALKARVLTVKGPGFLGLRPPSTNQPGQAAATVVGLMYEDKSGGPLPIELVRKQIIDDVSALRQLVG